MITARPSPFSIPSTSRLTCPIFLSPYHSSLPPLKLSHNRNNYSHNDDDNDDDKYDASDQQPLASHLGGGAGFDAWGQGGGGHFFW